MLRSLALYPLESTLFSIGSSSLYHIYLFLFQLLQFTICAYFTAYFIGLRSALVANAVLKIMGNFTSSEQRKKCQVVDFVNNWVEFTSMGAEVCVFLVFFGLVANLCGFKELTKFEERVFRQLLVKLMKIIYQ